MARPTADEPTSNMVDWDQLARNLLYGAGHRPMQVLRWVGGKLSNGEARPIGTEIVRLAGTVDGTLYDELRPAVPVLPPLIGTGTAPGGLSTPPPPPRWLKPSGPVWGLSCPSGYSLQRVGVLEVPTYSCLLNGAPRYPDPSPGDEALGLVL
jgi:hypothetical protein